MNMRHFIAGSDLCYGMHRSAQDTLPAIWILLIMPSLQSYLVNFALKRTVKRQLAKSSDISEIRERVEQRAAKYRSPKSVSIEKEQGAPVPGEWVKRRDGQSAGTMLYLHGGGYSFCSPVTHRPMTTFFARRLPGKLFVPDYRLAPEHPFPAALEDAKACYDWLLEQGTAPADIVVAGDSAGGGLTLALLLALRDENKPLPAAAALLSPYTDVAATGASLDLNSKTCAMFTGDLIRGAGDGYTGTQDPKHPLISPVYASYEGLPPLIIHASASECLLDDSTRVAHRAQTAGVNVEFEIWDGLPHVWHIFHQVLPEGRQASEKVTAFLRARLADSTLNQRGKASAPPPQLAANLA